MGKGPGIFHDGRDIDNPCDIDPAVADEGSDSGSFIIDILLRNVLFFGHQGPSGAARREEASAAAAEAWATVSGTSLGPEKTPLTKIPGLEV